jgi:CRP-like cAMP-binding protein
MNRMMMRGLKPLVQQKCRSFSFFNDHRSEEFFDFLRKQKILLRGAMVKARTIAIPLPFPLKRYQGNRYIMNYTLSNLAGHASFVGLALSYLESDFLHLRLYAIYGISMSIIFQYYRQVPLWIPIRWNTLFLLINAIMIVLLLIEENEAMNMTPQEAEILRNVFSNHGHMKAVDFRQLMSIAKKRDIQRGEKLVSQGVENNHIHLVYGGMFAVIRDQKTIANIMKSQFVGEMSFLSWELSVGSQLNQVNESKEEYNLWNMFSSSDSPLFHLPWSFDEETPKLEDLDQSLASSKSTTATTAASPMKKVKGKYLPRGQLGHADVVCMDDCIVYSWSFQELYDILVAHPSVGMVFEKTIAADLNEKMVRNWRREPKVRYKEVLAGILIDSEVGSHK